MNIFSELPPSIIIQYWVDYDRFTGIFTWLRRPHMANVAVGCRAGCGSRGYRKIAVPGFGQLQEHRLAWVYCHGDIPDGMEIDHIDGNPSNNRLDNLRLATSRQQKQNKRVQSNNCCGLKGAYYHAAHKGKKWRSQIKVDGKYLFLGYFHTAEEAHAAYVEAAPLYYGDFARVA